MFIKTVPLYYGFIGSSLNKVEICLYIYIFLTANNENVLQLVTSFLFYFLGKYCINFDMCVFVCKRFNGKSFLYYTRAVFISLCAEKAIQS